VSKPGNILIAGFWLYLIVDAYFQGTEVPLWVATIDLPDIPIWLVVVSLSVVFATCLGVTFCQRGNLVEDMPLIADAVNRRFGAGTYKNLNARLRPVSLSILSTFILAITALRATYESTRSLPAYLVGVLFLTISLGLLSAFLLSRRYPPELR
jgi:hypothetical protein